MDTEAVSKEILQLRQRLAEIEGQRAVLPDYAFTEKIDLLDEEHELQARLGMLRDSLSHPQDENTLELAAIDPRFSPRPPVA